VISRRASIAEIESLVSIKLTDEGNRPFDHICNKSPTFIKMHPGIGVAGTQSPLIDLI